MEITLNGKTLTENEISNYICGFGWLEEENCYDLFDLMLENLRDGMTFTLTREDCACHDHFLIFSAYDKQVITYHASELGWFEFDKDEPMLLEDCPTSFYRTLLLNISKGNYTITERVTKKTKK